MVDRIVKKIPRQIINRDFDIDIGVRDTRNSAGDFNVSANSEVFNFENQVQRIKGTRI